MLEWSLSLSNVFEKNGVRKLFLLLFVVVVVLVVVGEGGYVSVGGGGWRGV